MSDLRRIYMDHSATTPTDPRVVEAMMPYFSEHYGNPSSAHAFGRKAEQAIEDARSMIAGVLRCKPAEVIFTSGGSESDNLAIRGAALAAHHLKRDRLITTPVEHSAVSRTVADLAHHYGFGVSVIPVDKVGMIRSDTLKSVLSGGAALVSVMMVNNEVGTIQPITEVASLARQDGIICHTDAVQAAGQLSLDVQALGVDLLSLSAHKFYGPKGVGILYVREGTPMLPVQTGGSHERGLRAGTHNTPFIVGMAKALEIAEAEREEHVARFARLRDHLIEGILHSVPQAQLTGHPQQRLPSLASFVFDGIDGNQLLVHLDMRGVAASSASACKTGSPEPSDVLLAMGYSDDLALSSLRLTVGRSSTEEDVARTIDAVAESVEKLYRLRKLLAQ